MRHCSGEDPNLIQYTDDKTGERRDKPMPGETQTSKPCDCGCVFDDVNRSVVWPHNKF